MSTSSILYDITIYGAHTCLSGPYKYSLRFSESGKILKQSIRQIKFTWTVNYVSEIFYSNISDTIGMRTRRINRAAALCCHVGLTYAAAILRLENEARHANFEIALFQSVKKYFQHPLKSKWNAYGCKRDSTNLAIQNFYATIDLLEKRRERSSAELLDGELRSRFSSERPNVTEIQITGFAIVRVIPHALKGGTQLWRVRKIF